MEIMFIWPKPRTCGGTPANIIPVDDVFWKFWNPAHFDLNWGPVEAHQPILNQWMIYFENSEIKLIWPKPRTCGGIPANIIPVDDIFWKFWNQAHFDPNRGPLEAHQPTLYQWMIYFETSEIEPILNLWGQTSQHYTSGWYILKILKSSSFWPKPRTYGDTQANINSVNGIFWENFEIRTILT